MLLSQDRFVLIDFEADATVSQAERCAKHSPLRDVAALRHSLFLAALAARRQASQIDAARLDAAWRDAVPLLRDAFVRRYADAAVAGGLWADRAAFDAQAPLLDLFELERPLARLQRALERGSDDAAGAQETLAAWLAAAARTGGPSP